MRVAVDPIAVKLDRLYRDLIVARRAGDEVKADLTQAAIDNILDHWKELHQ